MGKALTCTWVLLSLLATVDCTQKPRKCKDHQSCKAFAKRKTFYCKHEWVRDNCGQMCGLCLPDCVDHRICRFYEVGKRYYCKHHWLTNNCKKMCGVCTPQCQAADHSSCSNYQLKPKFYCPHPWLKKNCNKMCGRCSDDSGPRWPEGQYGIVSRDKCPPKWYEFNHCMDNDNNGNIKDIIGSSYRMSPSLKCDVTSTSLRYCFKGPLVPTRPGGFWTNYRYNGFAYVIRNVEGGCEEFGSDGGIVEVDNEDQNNKNVYGNNGLNGRKFQKYHPFDFVFVPYTRTRISFCKIGEKGTSKSSSYIKVGRFGDQKQKFGLFVRPGHTCPTLRSPDGILHGRVENFYTDDEKYLGNSRVLVGKPPVVVDKEKNRTNFSLCQYNPAKAKKFTRKRRR